MSGFGLSDWSLIINISDDNLRWFYNVVWFWNHSCCLFFFHLKLPSLSEFSKVLFSLTSGQPGTCIFGGLLHFILLRAFWFLAYFPLLLTFSQIIKVGYVKPPHVDGQHLVYSLKYNSSLPNSDPIDLIYLFLIQRITVAYIVSLMLTEILVLVGSSCSHQCNCWVPIAYSCIW